MTTADEACGKCGRDDCEHDWTEGTCILPIHRNHSTRLLDGSAICTWCVDRHREWLTEVVELYVTLPDLLDSMTALDDGEQAKPSKQPEAPAPCRLEILSLLNPGRLNQRVQVEADPSGTSFKWKAAYLGNNVPDVPSVIGDAAAALYAALYGTDTAFGLADGAAFLTANAEAAARQPSIDDWDAELTWVRRHLMQAHGMKDRPRFTAEQQQNYPALICPTLDTIKGAECGGVLLPDESWRELHCARCKRVFREGDEMRRLGDMLTA